MKRAFVWAGMTMAVVAAGALGACGDDSSSNASDAGSDATASGDGSSFDSGGGGDDGSSQDGGGGDTGNDATGGDAGCTANPCIVQIAAGADQTCALVSDGTIRCWGQNHFGQLGAGGYSDGGLDGSPRATPVEVPGVTGVSQVATAEWGTYQSSGSVGFSGFSCARIGTSMVSCWGNNQSGQLGRGTDGGQSPINLDASAVVGLTSPTEISLDARNGCALSSNGSISCWGYNEYGELGPGPAITGGDPTPDNFMIDAGTPTHIAVGRYHACALLASGQVMCWGRNRYTEIGQPDGGSSQAHADPILVPGVTGAVDIVTGGFQTCVRTNAGQVLCWGRNNTGQLGRDAGLIDTAGPVDLPVGRTAKVIGIGTNHACAALDDDSVVCWGRNFGVGQGSGDNPTPAGKPAGQLGPAAPDGGYTGSPQLVPSLGGKVVQIVGGYAHTCALLQGGVVKCWGANNAGQLGSAAPDAVAHPTPAAVQF